MRVLFCKISYMKYYKGHCKDDIPYNGGSYVDENGYGHEEFNFLPIELEGESEIKCIGFFEPKSNKGKRNTVHIEKIEGCSGMTDAPFVDDVLVVWCATDNCDEKKNTVVVGWYKHATVFRAVQDWTMFLPDGTEEERGYNVAANTCDCTLLPEDIRKRWTAPTAKYTRTYGFGQSMVWYPNEPEAQNYLEKLIQRIESYDGENWIDRYPCV